MFVDSKEEPIAAARQFINLGFFQAALEVLDQIPQEQKLDGAVIQLKHFIFKSLNPPKSPRKWTVSALESPLYADPSHYHEGGYLKFLFHNISFDFVDQLDLNNIPRHLIVFGSCDHTKNLEYIAKFLRCHTETLVLVNLLDEMYRDRDEIYEYFDLVIRAYHSSHHATSRKVIHVPLGWFQPIRRPLLPPPSVRTYTWSFAGDVKKTFRRQMAERFARVENGFMKTTSGWLSSDQLNYDEYLRLMQESVFVLCPAGWANLESYRIWEALEMGAIPIIETRQGYNHVTRLCGPNPLPAFEDWAEAADFVSAVTPTEMERISLSCRVWWARHKMEMCLKVAEQIERA